MKNILFAVLLFTIACKNKADVKAPPGEPITPVSNIEVKSFGHTADGREAKLFSLTNKNGMHADIMDYGATVVSLTSPDRDGTYEDVVLGMDSVGGYEAGVPYFGAVVGRYGNRIANGKFSIDGEEYNLATNNGPNALHGGPIGYDKVYWTAKSVSDEEPKLILTYLSKDGEEGYPGNLTAEVTYTLTNNNALKIDYKATTDKPTVVNLTNHSYFNFSRMQENILGHELQMDASTYLPTSASAIPTGEIKKVNGGDFDFTEAKSIGRDIEGKDPQIPIGHGYDHCWILDDTSDNLKRVGSLYHSGTGRFMEVHTTEPAVQFYSGNFLDGTILGKNNVTYSYRFGLCLETQHYPDAPNQSAFPSTRLDPGETYESTTIYTFSAK